jgi:hypothetical protein
MGREAQVKLAFSALYPTLSPDRWYTAAAIAGLVKGWHIVHEGPEVVFHTRVIDPTHFVFRGGEARKGAWSGMRTRRLDRHPVSQPSAA